jgi:hypothetical protein
MAKVTKSAFTILGLAKTASRDEIDKAYREKMKRCHPDKVATLDPAFRAVAETLSKELNAAYAALRHGKGEVTVEEVQSFPSAPARSKRAVKPKPKAAPEIRTEKWPNKPIDRRMINLAVIIITNSGVAVQQHLQDQLRVGSTTAARLLDRLTAMKLVEVTSAPGTRRLLALAFEYRKLIEADAPSHETARDVRSIDLGDILTDSFMRTYTDFVSLEAMIEAAGLTLTREAFERLDTGELDEFVAKTTKFASWKQMMKCAFSEYCARTGTAGNLAGGYRGA